MENVEKFISKKAQEKETPESEEKLPPNVKVVDTEKGKFRIAYGVHPSFGFFNVEMKPEELGNADALVPELADFDYTSRKELVEERFNKSHCFSEYDLQYGKLIKKVKKEGKPIFLADITEPKTIEMIRQGLSFSEGVVAGALLGSLLLDYSKGEKWTEIETLKTIASIYFSSEAIGDMLAGLSYKIRHGILDEKSISRNIARFLSDLNERIHPETNFLIVTLRNSLFAQKLETIAERLGSEIKDRKPEVAITIGGRHHGIEKALKKEDKRRVWLINKLLSVPGLKKTREKIATIARFDFNKEKNMWEMTTDLKTRISQK